jgi:hypothetical protein
VELYYSSAWHDVSDDLSDAGLAITYGRSAESVQVDSAELRFTLDNSGNDYNPDNPNSTLYGLIGVATPVRAWVEAGRPRLVVTPGLGSGATTPDSAALSLSTDVELTIDVDLIDWRQSTLLIGKWETGTDLSYVLALSDGYLQVGFSHNGSTGLFGTADALVPIETGRLTVRGYLDQDDGSGYRAYTFSYSTTGVSGTFTQLGSVISGGTSTTLYDGTAPLAVRDDVGNARLNGVVHGATVRATAGGALLASPDFTAEASGTTSFDDDQGNTWTVQTGASLTDRHYRFFGRTASWTPDHELTGPTSATTQVVAAGLLHQLDQGVSPLLSPYTRAHVADDPAVEALVAYWPMEDGQNATSYGSGLPGKPPMAFWGSPNLASDSTFACSDKLTRTDATWTAHGPVAGYTHTGEVQVRFLAKVPTGGVSAETALVQFTVAGSAHKWRLMIDTSGNLRLYCYSATDATLLDSGLLGFAALDQALRYSVSLTQDGADVDWTVSTYTPGAASSSYVSNTLSSQTIGRCTYAGPVPYAGVTGGVFGHLGVQAANTGAGDELLAPLNAHRDETAWERVERLAGEELISRTAGEESMRVGGNDCQPMGFQRVAELVELMRQAAAADTGLLYEPRDRDGLAFRSGAALRSQFPRAELTWAENLLRPFLPKPADRRIRNKVKVTRIDGASATSEVTSGPLSTQHFPDGVGIFDEEQKHCLASDSQPRHLAGWATHIGTVREAPWPKIGIDLAHPVLLADLDLTRDVLDLDLGDRLLIVDPPGWLVADDVDQLVVGYTEKITATKYEIIFNCMAARPHRQVVYDHPEFRYSGDGTVTAETLDTTETGVDVTAPGGLAWTHDDGDFDLDCEGERMTVTAITGTAPSYTFTVVRSVNGVVANHASGVSIDLAEPSFWGQ